MIALKGLESSIARFTGVGAIRYRVGPFRAAGSGAGVSVLRINLIGHIIEAPRVEWEVARDHCIVMTHKYAEGTAVRIGNRFWKNVPGPTIEKLRWIEDLFVGDLFYWTGNGMQDFRPVEGQPLMTGTDIEERIRRIDHTKYEPLGIASAAFEWIDSTVRAILNAKGEKIGHPVNSDGAQTSTKGRRYGHCVPRGLIETAKKSVMDSLQERLIIILDGEISDDKYFIE